MHPDLIILWARADLYERLRAGAELNRIGAARRLRGQESTASVRCPNVVSLSGRRAGSRRRKAKSSLAAS